MMFKVVLACLAVGAAAFSPAAAGSRIVQSQVVASAAPLAEPMVARAPIVSMSAVTERDADGNPVVHTDMIDPIYLGVQTVPFLYLLLKFGGVL